MDSLFYDYEQVLIGNRNAISQFNFYGALPGGSNQTRALTCIRYVLEEILQWDINTCRKKFDRYIVDLMKMERLIEYIDFPTEIEQGDTRYILALLYPEDIKLNQKKLIETVYQNVLDGKAQFPREYFIGQKGFYRFCVCLCYLITNYKPFENLEDMYQFFSSVEGKNFLDTYRLKVPMEHLNIDVLKCINFITDEEDFSYLYYVLYRFLMLYQAEKQNEYSMIEGLKISDEPL